MSDTIPGYRRLRGCRSAHQGLSRRTGIELSALAAGWGLGGTVGVGTVVFALAIGPLVQTALGRLSVPVLTAPAE